MTPTNKLRFFERTLNAGEAAKQNLPAFYKIRILQQWWEADSFDMITGQTAGEWRDVPVEKEET